MELYQSKKSKLIAFIFLMIVAIPIVLGLTMSKENSLQEKIISYGDEKCKIDVVCKISLKEITAFDWDSAYILNKGLSIGRVEEIIGTSYPDYEDIGEKIIFIKDNKVIYSEEYSLDPEGKIKKVVDFTYNDDLSKNPYKPGYYYLTKENSTLNMVVSPNKYGGGRDYYTLSPSNEHQSEANSPYEKK